MNKPIAFRDGLTARYDAGEASVIRGLWLADGSERIRVYDEELTILLRDVIGRENVLRLLGEAELPIGRPVPSNFADFCTTEQLDRHEGQLGSLRNSLDAFRIHTGKRLDALEYRVLQGPIPDSFEERWQRREGQLSQAFERIEGRIEKLERWEASCKTRAEDNL